jgi:two-component system, OmpR family, response regulator
MIPISIAIVEDDRGYADRLSQYLQSFGSRVDAFADSNDLLVHPGAYAFDFYVVDLALPGVDGVELIKILRLRNNAGVLVLSGRLGPGVFGQVVDAGADMYLSKPVELVQVGAAIRAVHRRCSSAGGNAPGWTLDRRARQLIAPDGARAGLKDVDLHLLECFSRAGGDLVTRDQLQLCLGKIADEQGPDDLTATIYRLRRRIERATPLVVPLRSKSRIGYVFTAPLKLI